MKVAILGAGAYGRALGKLARESGHATRFFDPFRFPERGLEEVLEWGEAVILAAPAEAARKLLGQFPAPEREKPLIVATKGLIDLTIYNRFSHVELISGPGFASEILRGKRVKLTVTGGDVAEKILNTQQVAFDQTEDKRGVALLSGLKNIYAIEAGRRGLKNGSEEFKEYIFQAVREAEKILLYNGGFVETARLNAGVGDFVLTCGSRESRNYRLGELLAAGGARKLGEKKIIKRFLRENTVEGVFAAREIERTGVFVPREAEILTDSLRRIKDATKR